MEGRRLDGLRPRGAEADRRSGLRSRKRGQHAYPRCPQDRAACQGDPATRRRTTWRRSLMRGNQSKDSGRHGHRQYCYRARGRAAQRDLLAVVRAATLLVWRGPPPPLSTTTIGGIKSIDSALGAAQDGPALQRWVNEFDDLSASGTADSASPKERDLPSPGDSVHSLRTPTPEGVGYLLPSRKAGLDEECLPSSLLLNCHHERPNRGPQRAPRRGGVVGGKFRPG